MKLSVLSVAYPLARVGQDAAGGSEQILALLDRALIGGGHHSVVIAPEGSRTQGRLLVTPWSRGSLDNGAREKAQQHHREAIAQALACWEFDLIHMHSLDFYQYLPPAGPPVLATLHLPPDWYPEEVFRLKRPRTYLNCVSATQQSMCPPSALLLPYVENGVPLELLETRVSKRGFMLALGRICPEKGFHLALDAAAQARVPMLLAGEIFRYQAHENYFRDEIAPRLNGSCRRFVGPVGMARKRRLLASARCLLVPSLVPETSSLVTMEALACGTPVIAFPSGALAEIVEHGRTGYLVNNTEEMAEAIQAIGSIDPLECKRAARERFSATRMLERYFGLYYRLAQFSSTSAGKQPAYSVLTLNG
jgi:glycosyltransferase involved in cell wall biosynthesis